LGKLDEARMRRQIDAGDSLRSIGAAPRGACGCIGGRTHGGDQNRLAGACLVTIALPA
jgi:hypothetical protein